MFMKVDRLPRSGGGCVKAKPLGCILSGPWLRRHWRIADGRNKRLCLGRRMNIVDPVDFFRLFHDGDVQIDDNRLLAAAH